MRLKFPWGRKICIRIWGYKYKIKSAGKWDSTVSLGMEIQNKFHENS